MRSSRDLQQRRSGAALPAGRLSHLVWKLILRIDPHGLVSLHARSTRGSHCGVRIYIYTCIRARRRSIYCIDIRGPRSGPSASEACIPYLRSRAFFITRRHTPRYSREHLSVSSPLAGRKRRDANESRMKIEKRTEYGAPREIAIEHRCGKSIDRESSALFVTRSYKSRAPRVT